MDPTPINEKVLWNFSVINYHESIPTNKNLEDLCGCHLMLVEGLFYNLKL